MRMTEQYAMIGKLEWRNNARSMEIRMTEQRLINLNNYDERMRDQ